MHLCIFLVQYYLDFVVGYNYLSIIPWSVQKQYLQQILSILLFLYTASSNVNVYHKIYNESFTMKLYNYTKNIHLHPQN
jgi:hypothetical protein